jgi:hypothetical protein
MHVPRHIAQRAFGEIRALTPDEIRRMQSEIARVQTTIAQKESDLSSIRWNPLNYILETQRDKMAQMENAIVQDQHALDQLRASRDEVIESGDTERLAAWFDLAAAVGSPADLRVWREAVGFAKTGELAATVAKETGKDIVSPFGVPWWAWAGGLGVLWFAFGRRR